MLIISEKMTPRRRRQIFNDYIDIDAMLAGEQDALNRLLKHTIDDLVGAIRKIARVTHRRWRSFIGATARSSTGRLAGHQS